MHPETKAKYTVFPSDDPKAHILYQDCGFGNYMISTDPQGVDKAIDSGMSNELWSMEFYESCSSSGSRVGVVLIPPKVKLFLMISDWNSKIRIIQLNTKLCY